ncbi:hypothetical protein SAMN05443633_11321 [Chryseobacterium arachidis]|uniref:Uncharacterized protein n=2 Tax=Chryseobacterium arachidis TaxID=1416778 RepID=A0A1M5INV8_9FLAO|nr:hypothetical protein SAMN05443633_11321 [Chryseobacterium arachidis]
MDWDFEDFLKKAEGKSDEAETPVIPIDTKTKPSFPKWFWMAASLVLLFSIGFMFNYNKTSAVQDRANLVENQIKDQKNDFIAENSNPEEQVAVNHVNDTLPKAKKDSVFQESQVAEKDYLDDILPKRGRMKKDRKPQYVYNSDVKTDSAGYKDTYVIVNGKRITNEKEAIDVATYSLMKMGSEFKKTVASAQKNENFDNEY